MIQENILAEIEQELKKDKKNLEIPSHFIEQLQILFSNKSIYSSCHKILTPDFLKNANFEQIKEVAQNFDVASTRLNKITEELDVYLFLKEGYRLDYDGLMVEFKKRKLDKLFPNIDIKVLTDLYADPTKKIKPYYNTDEEIYVNPIVFRKFIIAILQMVFNEMDLLVVYTGGEGCQPQGSKVMMADGEWKNIEDIKKGDEIISPQKDGSQKFSKVLSTTNWFCNEVYDVETLNRRKRHLYSCSNNHLIPMNLVRTKGHTNRKRYWITQNIRADEYCKKSKDMKINSTSIKSGKVEFKNRINCSIEPYTLGVYLGDGCYSCQVKINKHELKKGKLKNRYIRAISITSADDEIMEYISKHYPLMNIHGKKNNRAKMYQFSLNGLLCQQLDELKLRGKGSGDKFIPELAKYSDSEYRLKLLAGLIDTDGYYGKKTNHYEYVTKSKKLAEDVYFLINSLGMRGSINKYKKSIKKLDFIGEYYQVNFYAGNIQIPSLLERKQNNGKCFYLSPNRYSIDVKKGKSQTVYGFELDSPSRWYITDNWMVTHNTGKSTIAGQHMLLIHQILAKANIHNYPYKIKQMMFNNLATLRVTEDDHFSEKFRQFTLDEGNELHRQNWKEEEVQTFFQRLRRERYNQRIKSICIPVLGELLTNVVMSRVNFIFEVYSENINKLGILDKGKCNFYIIPRGKSIYSYQHKKELTQEHIKQTFYDTLDKKNYLKGLPKELVVQSFTFNGTQGFNKDEYIKELKETNKSFNVKEGMKLGNTSLYVLYRLIKSGKLRPKNIRLNSKEPEYKTFHKLIETVRNYFMDHPRVLKNEEEKYAMKH